MPTFLFLATITLTAIARSSGSMCTTLNCGTEACNQLRELMAYQHFSQLGTQDNLFLTNYREFQRKVIAFCPVLKNLEKDCNYRFSFGFDSDHPYSVGRLIMAFDTAQQQTDFTVLHGTIDDYEPTTENEEHLQAVLQVATLESLTDTSLIVHLPTYTNLDVASSYLANAAGATYVDYDVRVFCQGCGCRKPLIRVSVDADFNNCLDVSTLDEQCNIAEAAYTTRQNNQVIYHGQRCNSARGSTISESSLFTQCIGARYSAQTRACSNFSEEDCGAQQTSTGRKKCIWDARSGRCIWGCAQLSQSGAVVVKPKLCRKRSRKNYACFWNAPYHSCQHLE